MKTKVFAVLVLTVSFVAACLAIWQLGWIREICSFILNAETSHDLVVPDAQVFGLRKELSLSLIFTGALIEVSASCALIGIVTMIVCWRHEKKPSIPDRDEPKNA